MAAPLKIPPEPRFRPSQDLLCAMWQGRCGNPAHLVIVTTKRIGQHDVPVSWLVCDNTRCWQAARWHAEAFGLRYVDSHRPTPADLEALTGQLAGAA